MNSHDREIAMELKRRLLMSVPLLDLRVFGSRARGDSDEFSDLDVFILVERIDGDLKQRIRDISALIFTKHEIEDTPLRSSQIVHNIQEEGVRI